MGAQMAKHLAIDIGSESGRAIVGEVVDGKLHTEEIYRFRTQFMQVRNRSIRNFYRYHEEILEALARYVARFGSELGSIGVDAWGQDFVLLNRAGDILRQPESYRANATIEEVADYVEAHFGEREVYLRTGNQRMPTDTLHQLIRLRQQGDPSLDDPRAILFVADVFHYMMGATPCCEHSMASYCRFYNVATNNWDLEIMQALGIPESLRTPVVYAGDKIGEVDPAILRQVGLQDPVPIVVPCSHDTACAALAVADPGSDWAFISSGTWSLLGMETERPVINDFAYANNFSNSSMPLRTNMFKKIMTGTWIIEQCKRSWQRYSYDDIVNLADASVDNDRFIDINATEFYAPEDMPAAVRAAVLRDFGSAPAPDDVGAIARIIFQSMALKYRYYLQRLLQASGKRIDKIYILGGGSKNRLINQFTANACGYQVSTGVYEASSIGNLLLQCYGCGELSDKACMRKIIMDTFPQQLFLPQENATWHRKYDLYLERVDQQTQW